MFASLGHLVFRRRRLVLVLATAFLALGAGWGTGVFASMTDSGFETPDSESARALTQIEETVGRGGTDVVVLYRHGGSTVDDPAFRAAVEEHLADLPSAQVAGVTTYWSAGEAPELASRDRASTYAVLQMVGTDDDEVMDSYEAVEP